MSVDSDANPSDPARRPGRPRDARAGQAILEAAARVLADSGTQGFTVEAVAAAAGVGKATIYRRWPTRAELMLDASTVFKLALPDPDSGSLRDDLVTHLTGLARAMQTTPVGPMLAGIIGEAAVNDDMRSRLRSFVRERRSLATVIVQRAVDRGELPADVVPEELLDLMGGPIFFRVLTGETADESFVTLVVDTALTGTRARPGP